MAPDSRYAPDSRARLTYIVNSLAQYEVHVARYYFQRGAYVAAISRALDELPERTRMAFEMHRLGGFTLQQVAQSLGVSTSLVHQLVHDALRHCLERLEGTDE